MIALLCGTDLTVEAGNAELVNPNAMKVIGSLEVAVQQAEKSS